MHCLVLGGAGFIGSHVVSTLVNAGHKVRLLDLTPNPYWRPPPQVECLWADWNDSAQVEHALTGIEVVIHLVSVTLPANSNERTVVDINGNLLPTLNLLQNCQKKGVNKVIFSSSGGTVYGIPHYLPIDEDHPTLPTSSYGIIKLTIEKYLHLYYRLYGLKYVVLRGANPYGIWRDPTTNQGAINVFLEHLAHSQPIEIFGDGSIVRDYFYVKDLALAFQAAAESQLDHAVLNVGSGKGLSLLELLDKIHRITGVRPVLLHKPARAFDVPKNVLNIERIRSLLGWQPQVSLSDGIRQTWDWINHRSTVLG